VPNPNGPPAYARIKPGESRNPAGSSKLVRERKAFRQWCIEFYDTVGRTKLAEMVNGDNWRDRQFALELIAAYGFGRPKQDVTGEIHHVLDRPLNVIPAPPMITTTYREFDDGQ
jgi:hypothetical protein